MYEEFDGRTRTKIVRDADGIARVLSHADRHVAAKAATPQLAANDYLSRYGHLLGLKQQHLKNLTGSVVQDPTGAPVDYRFLREKSQFDVTTVAFDQTRFGLAVWEAGISVTMKHNPLRVIGARSTLHDKLEVKRPSATHVARAKAIDVETLAKSLGLAGADPPRRAADHQQPKIHDLSLPRGDAPARHHAAKRDGRPSSGHPTLPLPPVHASIRDGKHYVVRAVYFSFDFPPVRPLHWVAMIEVETASVLLAYPFIANVMGWVFKADPATLGGPTANAGNAALNRWRTPVKLEGLAAPVDGTQALSGARVTVADVSTPKVAPPTRPAGKDFKYDARSNDFAAVNAYYNVDRIFRLVEELGFPIADYFPGTTFPSPVDHRGHFDKNRPRGNEINAHCAGNEAGTGIDYTIFALADTADQKNPIGIAGDWRIALHELLGHGVLYNHIGNARFKFAHSAGDSFAAILNDPDSKAKDRFNTFPWIVGVEPRRRHDRTAGDGWGWNGKIGNQSIRRCAGFAGLQQRTDPVVDDVSLLPRHRRRCRRARRQAICRPHDLPPPAGGHRSADSGHEPDRCRTLRRGAEQGRRRGLAGAGLFRRRLSQGDPLGVRKAGPLSGCRGAAAEQQGRPAAAGRRLYRGRPPRRIPVSIELLELPGDLEPAPQRPRHGA